MGRDLDRLVCDHCRLELAGEGAALVLVIDPEDRVRTVRGVRLACKDACLPVPTAHELSVVPLAQLGDVFDYADRVIGEHDWERGTINRLSQILTLVHRQRRSSRADH